MAATSEREHPDASPGTRRYTQLSCFRTRHRRQCRFEWKWGHAAISKYVYGQFIEHIAGTINNGIWAEMLVTSETPGPAQARRGPLRRWTPLGPDDALVMEGKHPYASDHAPMVRLNGAGARGNPQTGLAVRKGKADTGS